MLLSRLTVLSLIGVTALSACANKPWMMEKPYMDSHPMELAQSRHIVKKPLSAMTAADIADAARVYAHTGAGPMYVVVGTSQTGKSLAPDLTGPLTKSLMAQGVAAKDIVSSTIPLETSGNVAVIAFDTLEARGPSDCIATPGFGRDTINAADMDYKVGCGVKTMMAKQIANPADLKGVAGLGGSNDGQRAANIVNGNIRTGQTRDFIPSYVISTVGSGGS